MQARSIISVFFLKELFQLDFSPAEARHHGSDRDVERVGDFFVGLVFEIKKAERGAVDLIDFLEGIEDVMGLCLFYDIRLYWWELPLKVVRLDVGLATTSSADPEKLAIEGGEEPTLDLALVAEAVAFFGPDKEGFLNEVAGIGLVFRERVGEAIEVLVVVGDEVGKIWGDLSRSSHKRYYLMSMASP